MEKKFFDILRKGDYKEYTAYKNNIDKVEKKIVDLYVNTKFNSSEPNVINVFLENIHDLLYKDTYTFILKYSKIKSNFEYFHSNSFCIKEEYKTVDYSWPMKYWEFYEILKIEDCSIVTDESAEYKKFLQNCGIESILQIPIHYKGDFIGVISFCKKYPYIFDEYEVFLARQFNFILYNLLLSLNTKTTYETLILHTSENKSLKLVETLGSVMNIYDPYTLHHQNNVAKLALAIARELSLSSNLIDDLYIGCQVHDVGKLAMPLSILAKSGLLLPEEFAFIKIHPQAGFNILKNAGFNRNIIDIVMSHHERIDGSGYPFNQKGDEVSEIVRIASVADIVEAMSNRRPYREGLGIEKALLEIKLQRGVTLDANVVDACLAVFKKGFIFDRDN